MKTVAASALISAAIVGSLACVHGMATAHADTDSYIWRLENSGLGYTGYKASYVEAGYRVCADLSVGFTPRQIINTIYYNPSYDFSYTGAEEIVYVAMEELC
jgi:hypothetical protein